MNRSVPSDSESAANSASSVRCRHASWITSALTTFGARTKSASQAPAFAADAKLQAVIGEISEQTEQVHQVVLPAPLAPISTLTAPSSIFAARIDLYPSTSMASSAVISLQLVTERA